LSRRSRLVAEIRVCLIRFIASALILIGILGGCGGDDSEVIARVGDSVLTVDELLASIPESERQGLTPHDAEELIQRWVKTELIYRNALAHRVDRKPDVKAKLTLLEKEFVAQENLKRKLGEVAVSDSEIEGFHSRHGETLGANLRIRHILVRSRAEAESLRNSIISSNRTFNEAARARSLDPSARSGGDLGYLSWGEIVPEMQQVVFNLEVGEISEVFESPYGYHIAEVTEKIEGEPLSLEESRETIADHILAMKRRNVFESWIRDLELETEISLNPEPLISAITQPPDSISEAGENP
jgi:peptidyl-prolyl cis-trans isomerase C